MMCYICEKCGEMYVIFVENNDIKISKCQILLVIKIPTHFIYFHDAGGYIYITPYSCIRIKTTGKKKNTRTKLWNTLLKYSFRFTSDDDDDIYLLSLCMGFKCYKTIPVYTLSSKRYEQIIRLRSVSVY